MRASSNEKKLMAFIAFLILVAISVAACIFFYPLDKVEAEYDIVEINDIANTAFDNWNEISERGNEILPASSYEYAIVSTDGTLVYKTGEDVPCIVNEAVRKGCIIFDVASDETVLGKLIILPINSQKYICAVNSARLAAGITLIVTVLLLSALVYRISVRILKPFNKLKDFAQNVAAGDLDTPLQMDKANYFGAFTESFDMMRTELKESRKREDELIRDRSDMVAQLSHDIKTPVASIIATSELLNAKTDDDLYKAKLDIIIAKATQLSDLSDELNKITKAEQDKLNVECSTFSTVDLMEMIKKCDYLGKIKPFDMPEALVLLDRGRMKQVIDNVISNSYKYAGTDIELNAGLSDEFLILRIKDHGPGIKPEEISGICGKYVRGKDVGDKEGAGLGLFTARQLMNRMGGDFQVASEYGEYFEAIIIVALDI